MVITKIYRLSLVCLKLMLGCLWLYREVRPESYFGQQLKVFKVSWRRVGRDLDHLKHGWVTSGSILCSSRGVSGLSWVGLRVVYDVSGLSWAHLGLYWGILGGHGGQRGVFDVSFTFSSNCMSVCLHTSSDMCH